MEKKVEIEIKNLTKSYGNHKVLDNINLKINKGDIYGILGLSGAGKSTLIRCINGLERFDEGEIYFENEPLYLEKKIDRKKQRKIAMIFQNFNLLEQKTVFQNVKLALDIGEEKYSKEEKKNICYEALKRVNLFDKINSYPSELSGGEKQRVAIARALVLSPSVILSDEATSALDPKTTESILELLKSLNKELNLTIILISHQMNVIDSICNKVSIIDNSKIIESGEVKDVFLTPKSDIAKKLIYSNHINTPLEENKMIRIMFDGNVDEPLISNIVLDCKIIVSLIYANTKVVDEKVYGQTIIKEPKEIKDKEKLFHYLKLKNINYEEITSL